MRVKVKRTRRYRLFAILIIAFIYMMSPGLMAKPGLTGLLPQSMPINGVMGVMAAIGTLMQ